jgi:eukaryotic-like serine/threonine-protein kinase
MAMPDLYDHTGQTLRGYLLLEKVAKGSQAYVYRARHEATGDIVAVKILLPEYIQNSEFSKRFDGEVESIRRINDHPNIVPMIDHWRGEEGAVLILRWFGGGSLKALLANQGAQSVAYTGRMLEQIASVLHAAHGMGVVHRDVKPENILLDEDGNVHLGDFGIAKRSDANITSAGMMLGSPAYLAPEQLLSQAITPRTDGYSLGVTMYEALIGEHPYVGLPANQVLIRIIRQTFPPITSLRPDLPDTLNDFFRIATAFKPEDRYEDVPTMVAVYQALTADLTPPESHKVADDSTPSPDEGDRPTEEVNAAVKDEAFTPTPTSLES